jgi:hypothetical protein
MPVHSSFIHSFIIHHSSEITFQCRSADAALRPPAGRKYLLFTLTHGSGFAYARLHRGLTSHRAYGALTPDSPKLYG